ncbi:hypothetical protein BD779DRAFT_1472928 [Infundibulicybe gibba]|nr:hypothetical protein BD779DRAFT_1472928 [Infundibulicybe gibba]
MYTAGRVPCAAGASPGARRLIGPTNASSNTTQLPPAGSSHGATTPPPQAPYAVAGVSPQGPGGWCAGGCGSVCDATVESGYHGDSLLGQRLHQSSGAGLDPKAGMNWLARPPKPSTLVVSTKEKQWEGILTTVSPSNLAWPRLGSRLTAGVASGVAPATALVPSLSLGVLMGIPATTRTGTTVGGDS